MAVTRYPILNSRITAGGFGRALTRNEREKLRDLGVRVPRGTRVLRSFDCDYIGWLYKPLGDGLSDVGVSVTLVEPKVRAAPPPGYASQPDAEQTP